MYLPYLSPVLEQIFFPPLFSFPAPFCTYVPFSKEKVTSVPFSKEKVWSVLRTQMAGLESQEEDALSVSFFSSR